MRVVALTLDPSLGAALNMLDDWEITSARDVDEVVDVARGAQIVLIGVGGTEEGLDIAQEIHSRGVTIPSLVVGEGPVPSSPFAPVVLRPRASRSRTKIRRKNRTQSLSSFARKKHHVMGERR